MVRFTHTIFARLTNTNAPMPNTPAHGNENVMRADTNTSARRDKVEGTDETRENATDSERGREWMVRRRTWSRRKSYVSPHSIRMSWAQPNKPVLQTERERDRTSKLLAYAVNKKQTNWYESNRCTRNLVTRTHGRSKFRFLPREHVGYTHFGAMRALFVCIRSEGPLANEWYNSIIGASGLSAHFARVVDTRQSLTDQKYGNCRSLPWK